MHDLKTDYIPTKIIKLATSSIYPIQANAEIFSSLVAEPKSSTVLVTKPASEHNPDSVSSSSHSHNLFSKTHQNIITLFLSGYFPSVLSIKKLCIHFLFPIPMIHAQADGASSISIL